MIVLVSCIICDLGACFDLLFGCFSVFVLEVAWIVGGVVRFLICLFTFGFVVWCFWLLLCLHFAVFFVVLLVFLVGVGVACVWTVVLGFTLFG